MSPQFAELFIYSINMITLNIAPRKNSDYREITIFFPIMLKREQAEKAPPLSNNVEVAVWGLMDLEHLAKAASTMAVLDAIMERQEFGIRTVYSDGVQKLSAIFITLY